jgi:hypothetical protein
MQKKRTPPGISVRHSRHCPARRGGDCTAGKKDGCKPAYRAVVYDRRNHEKLLSKTLSGPLERERDFD